MHLIPTDSATAEKSITISTACPQKCQHTGPGIASATQQPHGPYIISWQRPDKDGLSHSAVDLGAPPHPLGRLFGHLAIVAHVSQPSPFSAAAEQMTSPRCEQMSSAIPRASASATLSVPKRTLHHRNPVHCFTSRIL
ncbi:hypothetical protein SKAU_G00414020 [Synaphobranchus kaupii]|uniref:Uncharacterized protein n=1 Tax=Synaphobranchus kaupii TaxID=118154 RepID=A0A9Q1E6Y4_SYNKA|nr:hypothetical protein SKAU_G00414020 [Synaphobranchus kaupii]